jgi:hypothetical protein
MREQDGVLLSFRGLPGSGKTTAADHFVRSFAATRVGFGDSIKAEAYERVLEWQAAGPEAAALLGWEPQLLSLQLKPAARAARIAYVNAHKQVFGPLLQWLGEGNARTPIDQRIAIAEMAVLAAWADGKAVAIDDTRALEELAWVREFGGLDVYVIAEPAQARVRLAERDGASDLRNPTHVTERLGHDWRSAHCALDNTGTRRAFETQLDELGELMGMRRVRTYALEQDILGRAAG